MTSGIKDEPPVELGSFDFHDRDQLADMYSWAGSAVKLSMKLEEVGRNVAHQTLSRYIQRYKLKKPQDAPIEEGVAAAQAIAELTAYLKNRPIPEAKVPVLKKGRQFATEIIGCDLHYPHHHHKAFEVFLGVIDKLKPQGVTLNGDTLDMFYLSRFRKNPRLQFDMQIDLDECRKEVFAPVRAAAGKAADLKVIMGNHELSRWKDYLWDKVPSIASLRVLEFEPLLGLAEMGWRYQPTGFWLTPALYIFHGERHSNVIGGGSGQAAKREMIDFGSSGASGHTHRLGLFYRRNTMQEMAWAEGGCLCDEEALRRDGLTGQQQHVDKVLDWHPGFLRIEYNPVGDSFIIMPYPIIEDKGKIFTIVDGEEIRA